MSIFRPPYLGRSMFMCLYFCYAPDLGKPIFKNCVFVRPPDLGKPIFKSCPSFARQTWAHPFSKFVHLSPARPGQTHVQNLSIFSPARPGQTHFQHLSIFRLTGLGKPILKFCPPLSNMGSKVAGLHGSCQQKSKHITREHHFCKKYGSVAPKLVLGNY